MSERDDKHSKDFHELRGKEGMEKIGGLVKGIRIAMMSTIDDSGQIHSRPMATQDEPFDGTLWFLTRSTSEKIGDIRDRQKVTLDYADPGNSKYITLRGSASVNQDRAKIEEMWNPMYKAWFPGGKDDPEIAVLRVDVAEGEYWDANSSKLIMGIRYVAAAVTGGAVSVGESGHVEVA
ncbi:MAG: pyridoxamine 5'-phosphate oxidase family protein [Acidobacteriaceae bacterium]